MIEFSDERNTNFLAQVAARIYKSTSIKKHLSIMIYGKAFSSYVKKLGFMGKCKFAIERQVINIVTTYHCKPCKMSLISISNTNKLNPLVINYLGQPTPKTSITISIWTE